MYRPNAEAGDRDVDAVSVRPDADAPTGLRGDGDRPRGRRVALVSAGHRVRAEQGRERRGRGRTRRGIRVERVAVRTSGRLRRGGGGNAGNAGNVAEKGAAPRGKLPAHGVALELRGPLGARGSAPPLDGIPRRARVAQRHAQPVGLLGLGLGARRGVERCASPEACAFRRRFRAARPRRRQRLREPLHLALDRAGLALRFHEQLGVRVDVPPREAPHVPERRREPQRRQRRVGVVVARTHRRDHPGHRVAAWSATPSEAR